MLWNGWSCSGIGGGLDPIARAFVHLGGNAPEWVVLLQNQGLFYTLKLPILSLLGGFAPECMGGFLALKLGGNAPVHPVYSDTNPKN